MDILLFSLSDQFFLCIFVSHFSVIQISKIDARIMQILAGMQKLEIDLEPASSLDFRSILIPLVKSFLRVSTLLRTLFFLNFILIKGPLSSLVPFPECLLLIICLQARLEDLAEKDAREKSDAAQEAFLAELAMDSKKGISAAVDNSKHEKAKDKKKSKDSRKNKDSKVEIGHYDGTE